MLKEFKKLRQVESISRKLFTDNYFDLYIWYKKNTEDFIGFQLVFCVNEIQMALTAEVGKIPNIRKVDSGDNEFYGPTDILDGVGFFPKTELYREFYERSKYMDNYIRDNILKVISEYKEEQLEHTRGNESLKLSKIY